MDDTLLNSLILVLNCGSSSIKFAVVDPNSSEKLLFGLIERLFLSDTNVRWEYFKKKYTKIIGQNISHKIALNWIVKKVLFQYKDLFTRINGIGHRVVHGGKTIKRSTIIDDHVMNLIEDSCIFAPLHNPANLAGIKIALQTYSSLCKKNVAVFDTSFYQNLPDVSFLYAIPHTFYKKYGIRRYGAHGISHSYVSYKTSLFLNKKLNSLNIISCHLGNGASVSAIRNGICVDTSMGLTPLEGLVMGTRSGDIDPSIIFFMYKKLKMNIDEIEHLLTKKSGLLGLSGISSDFRYFEKEYNKEINAKLAVDIFCHRLGKYIAAYSSLMKGRLDAVVFTGGIGENVSLIRLLTIDKLSLLGLQIDINKNLSVRYGRYGLISTNSSIPIFVVPTNEELFIAQETFNVLYRKI